MGGKEGNRGYVLQAIIGVLTVLENSSCKAIAVEPNDEDHKVDIKWEDNQGRVTACQVKSSINQFSKEVIREHLSALVLGADQSDSFVLTLIGGCSAETRKYFEKLAGPDASDLKDKYQHLGAFANKMVVEFRALDIKTQEGYIQSLFYKFLSLKGYHAAPNVLELISKAMIYQFSRFATEGKMLSKTEFENQLISWLTFNYPNQLHSENPLDLIFYNGGSEVAEKELTSSLRLPEITGLSYFKKRVSETKKLFETIESIKLPARSDQQKVVSPLSVALSQFLKQEAPSPADCTETDIEDIMHLSKKFLKLDTDNQFFQVGNVMKAANDLSLWALHQGPVYIGSDQEREKRELLDDLRYELRALKDLVQFWKKIKAYRIIPLVLVNSGKVFQESVDLQLSIPATVKLLMPENIALPKYHDNLEKLTDEGGWIEALFTHHTDINVNAYQRFYPRPVDLKIPNILGSRNRDLKEYAKYLLYYIFNFQGISGPEDMQCFSCNFRALKPGEKIALPAYLFVKADTPFSIDFKVRSNQCAGMAGKLKVI